MGDELITVHKLAYDGRETWRWAGKLVERREGAAVIDALFYAPPRDLGYVVLESTDLFHEFYYADCWFNIFQIFGTQGGLKGWYCNVSKPARFSGGDIAFVDMVLDLFVYPDGRTLVLDEEEFREKARILYTAEDTRRAEAALAELAEMVRRREGPFEEIGDRGPTPGNWAT